MAVYIRLNDAVEAFKKAEADDIKRYGCSIVDCFPAERAIDIICKCHKYLSKDYEPENEARN